MRRRTAGSGAAGWGAEDVLAESESQHLAGRTRIQVLGELGLDTIHVLTEALHAADGPLVIDLGHVTFADSSLLHALLNALPGHALVLTGPLPPQSSRLLDITGTRRLFTITPPAA